MAAISVAETSCHITRNRNRRRRFSFFAGTRVMRRISSFSFPNLNPLYSDNWRKRSRKKATKSFSKNCFLFSCFSFLGAGREYPIHFFRHADGDEVEAPAMRRVPHSLESLASVTEFTRDELKTMYRTFKNECPSGVVNEDTFKAIYSQFFQSGDSKMYAHYVFNAFDDRKEGIIGFEDFVVSLSSLLRGNLEDKLKWTFRLYDINQDGFITKEEIEDIVKSIYALLGKSVNPPIHETSHVEHADTVFKKLDKNGDGYVTYPEFLEACKNDENVVKSMKIFVFGNEI